jgi:ABC-type Fe3+ transport system substrate-binding protein
LPGESERPLAGGRLRRHFGHNQNEPREKPMPVRIAAIALGFFGFCGAALAAGPSYEGDPKLIAAAEKEGEVVLYTTWIVNQLARPMIAAFNARFPKIKVDFVRGDTNQNLLRLLNEKKAGEPRSDVWSLSAGIAELKAADGIARMDLPSVRALPDAYKDKDGYWAAYYINVHTPSYNTNLVAAKDAPHTYQDLLDPKWKGKMVWKRGDLTGSTGFIANILLTMGQEKGRAYLGELAKQNMIEHEGSVRAMLNNLIAGEYPLGLQTTNVHAALSKAAGAPVQWVAMEPVAVSTTAGGLTKGGPHPNAGKLFLDFVFSATGETVMRNNGYLPVRPDVPAKWPELTPQGGGFKYNVISPDLIDANYAGWAALEKQIFH